MGYANSKNGISFLLSESPSTLPPRYKQRILEHVCLSLQTKRSIFCYRAGTLFNQKHAVRSEKSTSFQCPLCQQADSALHILSGCQHNIISGMFTERHNIACRLIMKAISNGPLAGCLVHMDAGSTD